MRVLLEEGIGCQLAGLAAGGAEEITVDVIANAGRFDIALQILIETVREGDSFTCILFGGLTRCWLRTDHFSRAPIGTRFALY